MRDRVDCFRCPLRGHIACRLLHGIENWVDVVLPEREYVYFYDCPTFKLYVDVSESHDPLARSEFQVRDVKGAREWLAFIPKLIDVPKPGSALRRCENKCSRCPYSPEKCLSFFRAYASAGLPGWRDVEFGTNGCKIAIARAKLVGQNVFSAPRS